MADEPGPRQQKVNTPAVLIICREPSTDGKRLGSLAKGIKVTLAGKAVEGDKNQGVPVVTQDAAESDPPTSALPPRFSPIHVLPRIVHFAKSKLSWLF
ncbi:hypothetical protein [Prosthecobacter sp.]